MQADNISKIDVKSDNLTKMADRSCDNTHHRRRSKREKFRKCWKCGREGHLSKHKCCLTKKEKCRKCSCIGYFHNVCKSRNSKQTEVISVENNESLKDEIFSINLTPEEEPEGKVSFGGQEVHMLIDSGASYNVIDYQLWRQLKSNGVLCRSQSEPSHLCLMQHPTNSKCNLKHSSGGRLSLTASL